MIKIKSALALPMKPEKNLADTGEKWIRWILAAAL